MIPACQTSSWGAAVIPIVDTRSAESGGPTRRCSRPLTTSGSTGLLLVRVIPDTGADTTTLPWSDSQQLHLDPALGVPGILSGVAGGMAVTMGFLIWVWLDGQEYPCPLQADIAGQEGIPGRDVLNRLELLFRGPTGEILVNP